MRSIFRLPHLVLYLLVVLSTVFPWPSQSGTPKAKSGSLTKKVRSERRSAARCAACSRDLGWARKRTSWHCYRSNPLASVLGS